MLGPLVVRAKEVRIKIGSRRCTVAAGTPLAALAALRSKSRAGFGTLKLKDYGGGCGKRPSGSARLYLLGIGADLASGPDGWVYAVNDRSGTGGAADPAGAFSKGRLRSGQRVNWRWCAASTDPAGGCGNELVIGALTATTQDPAPSVPQIQVTVRVRAASAAGEQPGAPMAAPADVAIAVTTLSGTTLASGVTAADGTAVLTLPAGTTGRVRVTATTAPGAGQAPVAPAGRLLDLAG